MGVVLEIVDSRVWCARYLQWIVNYGGVQKQVEGSAG